MVVRGVGRAAAAVDLVVVSLGRLVAAIGAADFGESPGCGSSGCPGGEFITRLIGWVGQYSLWASFAAAVGGFGFWAWSKGHGGGVGMATGQRYILAGFAGVVGVALAATIADTLWSAASSGG